MDECSQPLLEFCRNAENLTTFLPLFFKWLYRYEITLQRYIYSYYQYNYDLVFLIIQLMNVSILSIPPVFEVNILAIVFLAQSFIVINRLIDDLYLGVAILIRRFVTSVISTQKACGSPHLSSNHQDCIFRTKNADII